MNGNTPMKLTTAILFLSLLPFAALANDEAPAEIDFLLTSVGNSNCTFIRNGERYDAHAAEDHLRMKYRNGKRYASTSERFIERLASKSYLSKKLYYIECEGEEKIPSGDWLIERLSEYRTDPSALAGATSNH
jgi:hypothetical protein